MSQYTDKLFNDLENGATWSAGVAFKRSNAIPLERYATHASLEDAEDYATNNAVAYPGQVLSVLGDNGEIKIYFIDENKGLKEVGTATTGDDASIVFNESTKTLGLYDFGLQYYGWDESTEQYKLVSGWKAGLEPRIRANEEGDPVLAWYEPDTRTAEGLNTEITGLKETTASLTTRVDAAEDLLEEHTSAIGTINTELTNVKEKLTTVFSFKGSKNTYSDLTSVVTNGTYTPVTGDVWNIKIAGGKDADEVDIKAGDNVVYNGTGWDVLSGIADLSGYVTKIDFNSKVEELQSAIGAKADSSVVTALIETVNGKAEQTTVNTLQGNVETLQETVKGIATNAQAITALQEKDSEIESALALKATIEQVNNVQQALQTDIDAKADKTSVTSLETTVDELSGDVDNLKSGKVDKGTYETAIEGLNSAIGTHTGQITDHTTRIESLETAKTNHETRIAKNETDIATINGTLSSHGSTITEHGKNISDLQASVSTKADSSVVTTLTERVATNETAIQNHSTNITNLQQDKADKTELNSLAERVEANETAIGDATKGIIKDIADLNASINAEITIRDEADKALDERIDSLEGQITGLSGAMHFIGVSTTNPVGENGKVTIDGTEKTEFVNGDVIIYNTKEYVYSNGSWVELGDVTEQDQKIAANQSAIGALNNRVDTIDDSIETINESIEATNNFIGTLPEGAESTTIVDYITEQNESYKTAIELDYLAAIQAAALTWGNF